MDEQETERLLAMLAGSHVTFFVSHLIGLKIKIHMAPGDILIMTSLIRGAARRSRPIALWEHGGFANHEPEPQVIINGRYLLDESEQLRLKVEAVIDAAAAQRAARLQSSSDAPPKMWRDGARYDFSHERDFVANERAAAGRLRRAIAGNAAITKHKLVAEAVEKEAQRVVRELEGELFDDSCTDPASLIAELDTAKEALQQATAELERRKSRERGGAAPPRSNPRPRPRPAHAPAITRRCAHAHTPRPAPLAHAHTLCQGLAWPWGVAEAE